MRVPFGLCTTTNKYLAIEQVERGKSCGCKCPSCDLPLIAKQGEKHRWHFAHDTEFDEDKRHLDCDFSYHASVRLMIKQELMQGRLFKTPNYQIESKESGYIMPITNEAQIEYDSVEHDVELSYIAGSIDAKLTVANNSLYLFISHKERPLKPLGDISHNLIELNIENLEVQVEHQSSVEALRHWLTEETKLKRWRYHAREAKLKSHFDQKELDYLSQLSDTDLRIYCIKKAEQTVRLEKGIDLNLMGWRGLWYSRANDLFKQIRRKT